jgi:transposase
MMSLLLAEVRRQHPRYFIIMVLDGAGMNIAKGLCVPMNMRIVFQPPYSPRLNPSEPIWGEIHEKAFPNIAAKSLAEVEDRLELELKSLGQDRARVKSITGYDWILDIPIE